MTFRRPTLALLAAVSGALVIAVFAIVLVRFRATLRSEVHRTIINRDAAVLLPVALRQIAQHEVEASGAGDLFTAVLETAQQDGMLAVAVFDADGRTLRTVPETLLFAELSFEDYLHLLRSEPISRLIPEFQPSRYFAGASNETAPVLEVLLPLHGRDPEKILGFAQYYIDARPLAGELAAVDGRVARLTTATLIVGALLIAAVVAFAYLGLRRAALLVEERTERLMRANFELSLAAKASALGQITSHLIHGLQGPVAGLRAMTASQKATGEISREDWAAAASYAERMQALIAEAVGLLGDSTAPGFELNGHELVEIIRKRSAGTAAEKGVRFEVHGGFERAVDGHRGGLLCLITSNLVQNAIEATAAGRAVTVALRNGDGRATVVVSDEGRGIPEDLRAHLFEPGRSGRAGGSGLGLAISRLLARQIDASLSLEATGETGTTFQLSVPLKT